MTIGTVPSSQLNAHKTFLCIEIEKNEHFSYLFLDINIWVDWATG